MVVIKTIQIDCRRMFRSTKVLSSWTEFIDLTDGRDNYNQDQTPSHQLMFYVVYLQVYFQRS